jgi:hypothetical protein
VSGPLYLQQIQSAQQQGQAQQALDAAQRKVTSQTLGRQPQPLPIPQQPQPHYLRELSQQSQIKYVRPAAQAYRPVPQQVAPEAKEQQNPEDYDVSKKQFLVYIKRIQSSVQNLDAHCE